MFSKTGRQLLRAFSIAAMTIGLVACGGGGGSSQASRTASIPGMLTGAVTYESVPNSTGALDYSASSPKPVRGAVVEVLDASTGAVLATSATDAGGNYAVAVPADTMVSVRIRAQTTRGGGGPNWDVSVRDNTQDGAIYAIESAVFSTNSGTAVRDVFAPSGWGGTSYTTQRAAAPFAILDTIYTAMNKVLTVEPQASFPPLRVYWSVDNVPADGRVTLGQIGTTSFATDPNGRVIYVLGKENVDTDEYDASVIAHEWGHYYQSVFSRDDSPGGPHSTSDRLDMRLAFSEGWGTAWSGIALGRSNYTDAIGPGQGAGANVNLAAGANFQPGWFREVSIESIFWRLNEQLGFAAIHNAMARLATTPAVTAIHSFAAALVATSPSATGPLASNLAAQAISAVTDDAFGSQESNDGGVAGVLPLYRNAPVGQAFTACVTNQAGPFNKLGSFAYLRFQVQAGQHQISVTGPAQADPDFTVFAGSRIASSEGPGSSEVATVTLPDGGAVLVLNDANDSSASTCFNVTIQ